MPLNALGELKQLTSQNCDDNSKRETGPKSQNAIEREGKGRLDMLTQLKVESTNDIRQQVYLTVWAHTNLPNCRLMTPKGSGKS